MPLGQTVPTQTFFWCLRHEKKFVWVDEKKFVWVELTHDFNTNTTPTQTFFRAPAARKKVCVAENRLGLVSCLPWGREMLAQRSLPHAGASVAATYADKTDRSSELAWGISTHATHGDIFSFFGKQMFSLCVFFRS